MSNRTSYHRAKRQKIKMIGYRRDLTERARKGKSSQLQIVKRHKKKR